MAAAGVRVGAAATKRPRTSYHLTSSLPIVAYQFSALEYEGKGGGEGKDWGNCPGLQNCTFDDVQADRPVQVLTGAGCIALSDEAHASGRQRSDSDAAH